MSIPAVRLMAGTDRLGDGVARILVIDDEATVRHRGPFDMLMIGEEGCSS
jgi:hypothetical protein